MQGRSFWLSVVLLLAIAGVASMNSYQSGNVVKVSPSPFSRCGDTIFAAPEQCEDCNTFSKDGCSSTCRAEYCGDGIVQSRFFETCDGHAGCPAGMLCDPNSCASCYTPRGSLPIVTVAASPSSVTGAGTVQFTVTATDPDDLLVSYNLCLTTVSVSRVPFCKGGAGGRGCTNSQAIQPTNRFSLTYQRVISASTPNPLSSTHIEKLVFYDQSGNRGEASVVIPIY